MEEGDADERETALREAKEEIGLDPSLVTVVTVLEPFLSRVILLQYHNLKPLLFFFCYLCPLKYGLLSGS